VVPLRDVPLLGLFALILVGEALDNTSITVLRLLDRSVAWPCVNSVAIEAVVHF
jgi:hypothetical protein